MIVKIKCVECGIKHKVKVTTMKIARKTKKNNKNYICNKCKFKIMVKGVAKEIVRQLKRIC
ncbi:MAG: DNA-directed RNA polymerase subunit RPC12/RpoP [Clostridium sp.]|jgi:DNA-directed RNA polymerase subunit RPC12/RpoP